VDLQSDFSCLISKAHFDDYLLPFIEEQTRWVDRTIYHLDGPGAVKHLESLLDLPELDGIQWVQGAGAPPATHWISLYRRIQERGKLVYAFCEPGEVETLLTELRREGLMLVTECASEEDGRRLLEGASRWSARR
jgi:hypothetical protein